jgi:N-acetyl-1-D-myo-inositol-2-amino-2-deoxy-alpha-D-glucopyranoside deacetylase
VTISFQEQQSSSIPRLHGRTVIVLHAHPDDEAIFTGVTIRRLADAGARVVMITATNGDLGEEFVPLGAGESISARRSTELERAAGILGVSRLIQLGRRDSGLPGWPANQHPEALISADSNVLARDIADIAAAENAEAIVHYDRQGIYGHPDHLAVHRIGRAAAELAGVTAYESTVDREHLRLADGRKHLIYAASNAARSGPFGHVSAEITLAVAGEERDLRAKRDAIVAHSSQVRDEELARLDGFARSYGLEWYVRVGAPGLLDELGNAHIVS